MSVLQSHTYDQPQRAGKAGLKTALLAMVLTVPVMLGACTPPPTVKQEPPQITFSHLAPIRLDTRAVQVIKTYRAPFAAPNIDHVAPVPPIKVLQNWIADRLATTGGPASLTVEITDASLIEKPLARKGNLESTFKAQPVSEITGRLAVRLAIQGDDGSTANAEVITQQRQTLLDNLSLAERDQKLLDFVEGMGQDLNRQMEQEIRRHLTRFIR